MKLVSVLMAALVAASACASPGDDAIDLGETPQEVVTNFGAGTLIIPTSTNFQDAGMLRAYGLVYRLLDNGVPVRWIAQAGKVDQGIDIVISAPATVVNRETGAAIGLPAIYRGGPFLIAPGDRAAALPIITAWLASDGVTVVHDVTAGTFSADVQRVLSAAPRIGVLEDGFQGIAYNYLNAAGIPDGSGNAWSPGSLDELSEAEVAGVVGTPDDGVLNAAGSPYCHLLSMHYAGGTSLTAEVVREVRTWLDESAQVHAYMQCESVETFENAGRFLTTTGIVASTIVATPVVNRVPPHLLNQYHGSIQADGGPTATFQLPGGGAFDPGTTILLDNGSVFNPRFLWVGGNLDGDPTNGRVTYLTGHDYATATPISANPQTNAVRLMLNSLLESNCAISTGDQPVARDDVFTTFEGNAALLDVRANDSGLADAPITQTASDPPNGFVAVAPDGRITYVPDPDFNGVDTFTYTLRDADGDFSTATVTVNVMPVNDTPVASPDTATTPENTPVVIAVLANDSGLGDRPLGVSASNPPRGSATVNADNTITYTPDPATSGVDTFTYTVRDVDGQTAMATVTVTVTESDDVPDARDDTAAVPEDGMRVLPVLGNDTGLGDAPITMTATDPPRGTVTVGPTNTITYAPDPNFHGTDTFTYTIRDADGDADTALVTMTVVSVNDTPVANVDMAATTSGTPVVIPVLANDTGLGDTPIQLTVMSPPNGIAMVNGNTTITYAPFPPFSGTDVFRYRIQDADGQVAIGTVVVTVTTTDADGDNLQDATEVAIGTNPNDADSDDDGIGDGDERDPGVDLDGDGRVNALDGDSDGDGLFDGTEVGLTAPGRDTDVAAGNFVPDDDPGTNTDPRDADTDDGSVADGVEDEDRDGRVDDGERDPNDPTDDIVPDADADGVPDEVDNCPVDANPAQDDTDADGEGDLCDEDDDGDGFPDGYGVEGGGGCAAGGGQGGAAAIAIVLALAVARRRRRIDPSIAGALALVLVLGAPGVARAQEKGDFTAERFELASGPGGILGVESAGLAPRWDWDVHLWLGTADDPLVVYMQDGDERREVGALVGQRTGGELGGSLVVHDRIAVGLDAPLVLAQDRTDLPADVMSLGSIGGGLGDLRVSPKVRVLAQGARAPVDLAIVPALVLPTSLGEDYRGNPGVSFAPYVAVSQRRARLRWAVNLGYALREEATVAGLVVDDELRAKAGVAVALPRAVDVNGQLSLATAAGDPFGDRATDHVELLAGPGLTVARRWHVFAAGGVGLREGHGTPDWRALAGVRVGTDHPPPPSDHDRDGLIAGDGCPREPEDADGFQDEDGCPDPDNDQDLVLDAADGAPLEPEDRDGIADEDGVPDLDDDHDRIRDKDDWCPLQPETDNGFKDEDGCPDELDDDGDGLHDLIDQCPVKPEDKDGFADEDGCPEDNDEDGLADAADGCPNQAGPADNRGCPDPDRDGDSLVDRLDNCPDEAGTPANHGCKTKQLAVIRASSIEILDVVHFATGKAVIQKRSHKLLASVAAVIRNHPELTKVVIEGHTDDVGDEDRNLDLSSRRADAVRAFLIGKGIDETRLVSIGHGETRPLIPKTDKKSRAANRRVEFKIER